MTDASQDKGGWGTICQWQQAGTTRRCQCQRWEERGVVSSEQRPPTAAAKGVRGGRVASGDYPQTQVAASAARGVVVTTCRSWQQPISWGHIPPPHRITYDLVHSPCTDTQFALLNHPTQICLKILFGNIQRSLFWFPKQGFSIVLLILWFRSFSWDLI